VAGYNYETKNKKHEKERNDIYDEAV